VVDTLRVELRAPADPSSALGAVAGVKSVTRGSATDGWEEFGVDLEPGADPRAAIYELAKAKGWTLRELSRRTPSLEQVFMDIIHADHR
jgi:hypothetical protein